MLAHFFKILFFIGLCAYLQPVYGINYNSKLVLDTIKPKMYRKYTKKIEKVIQSFDINPKEVYNSELKDWSLSAGVHIYSLRIEYNYTNYKNTSPFLIIYGKLMDIPEDEDAQKAIYVESLAFNYSCDFNKISLFGNELMYLRIINLKKLSIAEIKAIIIFYTGEFAENADYYQQKYGNIRSRKT